MKVNSLRHVGIVTSKIEESICFYRDLGFEVYWDKNETSQFINTILGESIDYLRTVKMKNDNFSIELLDFNSTCNITDFNITSHVITHISVDVEDIRKLFSKNQHLFKSEPQLTSDKRALVAFMKDPNNSLFLELVQVL